MTENEANDASGILVNAPASYYRAVTNANGNVRFELNPDEATPIIASDGEEAAFIVGDGDSVSVSVANVKGGLYYCGDGCLRRIEPTISCPLRRGRRQYPCKP